MLFKGPCNTGKCMNVIKGCNYQVAMFARPTSEHFSDTSLWNVMCGVYDYLRERVSTYHYRIGDNRAYSTENIAY